MPRGRHRQAPSWTRRAQRWGGIGSALLVLASAVPIAVALDPGDPASTARAATALPQRKPAHLVSRDYARETPPVMAAHLELGAAAQPTRLRPRWTTGTVAAVVHPERGARAVTTLAAGSKVQVTGTTAGPWAEVVRSGRSLWVLRARLSRSAPHAGPAVPGRRAVPAGVSFPACPDGSGVESGLVTNTIKVYRAVCAAFPQVSSWGGRSGEGSGDHGTGHALDIMCSGSLGDAIAAYVRSHASQLGVSYVIWAQHIWSVERGGEGWRAMPDRGSSTANHFDHVHVSTY